MKRMNPKTKRIVAGVVAMFLIVDMVLSSLSIIFIH